MSKKQEDSILIDYFKYTKIYQSKYGNNTIVFMQVGAFFEVYSLKNPNNQLYEITKIQEFSEICNLNIAEKKITLGSSDLVGNFIPFPEICETTPEVSITKQVTQWLKGIPECKVVMAGVRDYQVEKYIQKMSEHGFTVVVFVQEKDQKGSIKRKLQNIYSPGTFLSHEEESSTKLSNHIMSIWIEKTKPTKILGSTEKIICGISCLNIFTGESHIFEYETNYMINPTTFDELERSIATFSPKEVIIISELDQETLDKIIKYIGLSPTVAIHTILLCDHPVGNNNSSKEKAMNCTKQTYIKQLLNTFYGNYEIYETCMEFQTNTVATQSFCFLPFIKNHPKFNSNHLIKVFIFLSLFA